MAAADPTPAGVANRWVAGTTKHAAAIAATTTPTTAQTYALLALMAAVCPLFGSDNRAKTAHKYEPANMDTAAQ